MFGTPLPKAIKGNTIYNEHPHRKRKLMSIRLSKAIRELNIGLPTAVEFLQKKLELSEESIDVNYKLSDNQYKALIKAFKNDKDVKDKAADILQKKAKDKKESTKTTNHSADSLFASKRQKYTPLGKIDLQEKNKPSSKGAKPVSTDTSVAKDSSKEVLAKDEKTEQVTTPKQETPEVKEAKADKLSDKKEAQITEVSTESKQEKQAKIKNETINVLVNTEKKVENIATQGAANVETETKDEGIFKTKNEEKMLNAPKVNVLGKIDLSSLNQSTRPKKKSKEERKKEREDKAEQKKAQSKKKRVRINKERVDINASANQQGSGQGNRNKSNNNSHNNNRGSGKKNNRNNNNNRNHKPLEVDDEAVARQVKETLARLTSKTQNKKGAKYRKEKREAVQEKLNAEARAEKRESKVLKLTEFVTVSELATMMNVPVTNVISTLMSVGIMVSINQRLDAETINLVADEFNFKTEYVSAEVQEAVSEEIDDENDLVSRAPIVTVMGHVDHGKTSLLDYIRNTNVIAGEAGGITQHIGAYCVKVGSGKSVTFLDTPGHEAFTAMRARGTQVTDIAIIIIAADDSVMPTTREAISHAQAAGVPMVFAINKIDKPGANPDKIREDLSQMNLLVEEWGGKYQCQEISAKKGIGVEDLLDKVLLEAEMLDLKANPNRKATGTIIESSLDKGRGYVSTNTPGNWRN